VNKPQNQHPVEGVFRPTQLVSAALLAAISIGTVVHFRASRISDQLHGAKDIDALIHHYHNLVTVGFRKSVTVAILQANDSILHQTLADELANPAPTYARTAYVARPHHPRPKPDPNAQPESMVADAEAPIVIPEIPDIPDAPDVPDVPDTPAVIFDDPAPQTTPSPQEEEAQAYARAIRESNRQSSLPKD